MQTKEQKGIAVFEQLEHGEEVAIDILATMTEMSRPAVHQGIAWLRDYDPNCLVIIRHGRRSFYKLAVAADEVRKYVHGRSRSLYKMAQRLERMVENGLKQWPEDETLEVMERHLRHMREDVEVLRRRSE